MKIFNKYYLFNDDISILDRRFFFSLVAAALTDVFIYRLLLILRDETFINAIKICYKDNDIIFFGAIALSLIHFILYYKHLKMNFKCIISKEGILTFHKNKLYSISWRKVSISEKYYSTSSVMSNLIINYNTSSLIINKIFEVKQSYLFGISEKFRKKVFNNKIEKFEKWKDSCVKLSLNNNIRECGIGSFFKNIAIILFGYSLLIYFIGFLIILFFA